MTQFEKGGRVEFGVTASWPGMTRIHLLCTLSYLAFLSLFSSFNNPFLPSSFLFLLLLLSPCFLPFLIIELCIHVWDGSDNLITTVIQRIVARGYRCCVFRVLEILMTLLEVKGKKIDECRVCRRRVWQALSFMRFMGYFKGLFDF